MLLKWGVVSQAYKWHRYVCGRGRGGWFCLSYKSSAS